MPSFQSYLYRILGKGMARFMDIRPGIDRWRNLSTWSSQQPQSAPGVTISPVTVEGVRCEWLIPEQVEGRRTILYLHGGGFILGWYNTHRRMVGYLAKLCKARTLAVDYRLAPEYPYPAALDDCALVYRCLIREGTNPHDMIIAGDSAGGNLVLALMLTLKQAGDPLPAAGVCMSPATDMATRGASYEENARREVILPRKLVEAVGPAYVAGADPYQPGLSPLYGDLQGLPPLLIQAGSDEILLSDATRFAEKACAAGVSAAVHVYPGMWHVWQIFYPGLPEAREAIEEIRQFAEDHWNPV